MNALKDIILLGTTLRIDTATPAIVAAAVLPCIVLAVTSRRTLQASTGARTAFFFVLTGALIQCLAGELVLFLAGGAVLGYAMLALSLAGPRKLTRFHALAAAILIVLGDLALLEFVMLLAKSSSDLSYSGAGDVLAKTTEGALARFCLVLGFGSRLALVALCVPEGRSSAANIATLPGWLLLGLTSTVGAIRLFCGGGFGAACASPGVFTLWWVPPLSIIAWQLPRSLPLGLRLLRALGTRVEELRDAVQARAGGALRSAGGRLSASTLRLEKQLSLWPVAISLLLLLTMAFALAVYIAL